jgi:hypothetical protein
MTSADFFSGSWGSSLSDKSYRTVASLNASFWFLSIMHASESCLCLCTELFRDLFFFLFAAGLASSSSCISFPCCSIWSCSCRHDSSSSSLVRFDPERVARPELDGKMEFGKMELGGRSSLTIVGVINEVDWLSEAVGTTDEAGEGSTQTVMAVLSFASCRPSVGLSSASLSP